MAKAPEERVPGQVGHRWAAWLTRAWAKSLANQASESAQCPTLRRLEEYVAGRTALLLGGTLLAHFASCAPCRRQLAALNRMETKRAHGWVWRLSDIRVLAKQGSERAAEVAVRAGQWLAGLADGVPPGEEVRQLACSLECADGQRQEIPAKVLGPLTVDAEGRLLLRLVLGLPTGMTAAAEVYLEDDRSRLELFATDLSGPSLEAIVDLSCCLHQSVFLPLACLGLSLKERGRAPVGTEKLTMALEMLAPFTAFSLASVDQLAEMAERGELTPAAIAAELAESGDEVRTALALSGVADLLSRYLRLWAVGNQGNVPERLADLFAVIICQLSVKPSAQIAISTSFGGQLVVPITEGVGEGELV